MHDSLLLLLLFLFRWFCKRVSVCAFFPSIRSSVRCLRFGYSHVCVIVVQVLLLSFKNLNKCHFLRIFIECIPALISLITMLDPAANSENHRIYYSRCVCVSSICYTLSSSVYIIYTRARTSCTTTITKN